MVAFADLGPAIMDLKGLVAGDYNEMVVQVYALDAPLDLTGFLVEAMIRPAKLDPAIVVTGEVTMTNPAEGEVTVRWDGDAIRAHLDSLALDTWTGVWDLQVLVSSRTQPDTIVSGAATLIYDVTRP